MSDTAPLFAGIGGHQSARSRTDEWLTDPAVILALGGADSFDLDPCAPAIQPYPTARATFTVHTNGLLQPWHGRVWLNPPYSQAPLRAFMGRMAAHNRGTALIFARTETDTFWRFVWESATALLFLRGRQVFRRPDGSIPQRKKGGGEQNSGAPSVLCAYGTTDADLLAFCGLAGRFVPLRIPRGVFIFAASFEGEKNDTAPWRTVIADLLNACDGTVKLEDLYRALAGHPKARRNPNWRAKIRQQLQQGPFERVARGQWRAAHV